MLKIVKYRRLITGRIIKNSFCQIKHLFLFLSLVLQLSLVFVRSLPGMCCLLVFRYVGLLEEHELIGEGVGEFYHTASQEHLLFSLMAVVHIPYGNSWVDGMIFVGWYSRVCDQLFEPFFPPLIHGMEFSFLFPFSFSPFLRGAGGLSELIDERVLSCIRVGINFPREICKKSRLWWWRLRWGTMFDLTLKDM